MDLSDELIAAVSAVVGAPVRAARPLGGGCIARATRLDTGAGPFFLKWSPEPDVARTFTAEAAGLRALREAGSPLRVPEPLHAREAEGGAVGFLLVEWIEPGTPGPAFWERFGEGLAAMHRHTSARYGFEGDNFIGRLPQQNAWHASWVEFFRTCRLAPQVERARSLGRWQSGWDRPLERLYARLPEVLPERPPASVLHGDLWSGNFLVDAEGRAALVDPAAYYGDREADLAMTELFGGFDRRFYDAYRVAWPLPPGYELRREVYNLYHLVNHLNHFGGGYAGSVAALLGRFA